MERKKRSDSVSWSTDVLASLLDETTTGASFNTSTQEGLEAWIYWNYRKMGFDQDGVFRGLTWLRKYVCSFEIGRSNREIRKALSSMIKPQHKYSLHYMDDIKKSPKEGLIESDSDADIYIDSTQSQSLDTETDVESETSSSTASPYYSSTISSSGSHFESSSYDQTNWSEQNTDLSSLCSSSEHGVRLLSTHEDDTSDDESASISSDFDDLNILLSSAKLKGMGKDAKAEEDASLIQYAPLVDVKVISSKTKSYLPQFGLLGSHDDDTDTPSKLFLNTNVPFSMFICGVQGSGKSHTTSCVLENSLIRSPHLGRLKRPLSALVFSFAPFNGDGTGFTICEAAFLASSGLGTAHVKRVNVLVPPSNFPRISKLYAKLPNVRVTPFKIPARNLDIETMLTLMNVRASDKMPLYMTQVMQILRDMSTRSGSFDYHEFKDQIQRQNFSATQESTLQMRLGNLESFLDLDNDFAEPYFRPGEVTIMDMSCPFVDANLACFLFKIGLKLYLQTKCSGKLLVLDEAHKYMLKTPGAKSLNDMLLQTVRLERHYGTRVIVSTQEPTILTNLIALCSVIVIHRFSSPEWLSAITRHIPSSASDRDELMQRIESLTTGTALVYSPKAVLGRDENGELIMGTGEFIDVEIRRRITSDGGRSILAV